MSRMKALFSLVVSMAALLPVANAQAPAARFVGTISSIEGSTLVVKSDNGELHRFAVPATAVIKRVEPGQKDLSTADVITAADLAVGDRALVKLDAATLTAESAQAAQIIAIKQADVARKQQAEREEWQRHGASGLVKSVDAATGTVVISVGSGATARQVMIHTGKSTQLKRYGNGSIRFDTAQVAPIEAIHAGDQLHARGVKSADGGSLEAAEVVSGSFRSVAATVISVDVAAGTIEVKDLATKKPVTIHTAPESQLKRLPADQAQALAARLKGGAAGQGNGRSAGAPPAGAGAPPAGAGAPPMAGRNDGNGNGNGNGRFGQGGNDPAQIFNRAPAMAVSEIKKGEAVMLVATESKDGLTAVTFFAGVEALLESSSASQDLLSNWSMGSGGAEGGMQ